MQQTAQSFSFKALWKSVSETIPLQNSHQEKTKVCICISLLSLVVLQVRNMTNGQGTLNYWHIYTHTHIYIYIYIYLYLYLYLYLDCTHGSKEEISESTTLGLHACETSTQKQFEGCADTTWGRYWLWPQLTGCHDLQQIEENYKVPKENTTMGFGEIICSMTKSAG